MAVRYLTKDLKRDIDQQERRIDGMESDHEVYGRRIGDLEKNDAIQDLKIETNCKSARRLSSAVDIIEIAIIKMDKSLSVIETSNAQTNKIASWAIGIITTILVAVLIGLVTGQATLQFK